MTTRIVATLVTAFSLLLYLAPEAIGMAPDLGPPAAIVLLALGFWASGVIALHQTALLIFALVTVLEIAPPSVIFSGFAATGLWLVFGGLVIAAAIEVTGLGSRLAQLIAARLEGSYRRVIYGTVLICLILAFLVPAAMGRIMILIPIFRSLAHELGLEPGSRGEAGVLLAVTFGSFLPTFAILPANLPNMVLLGAAETLYGFRVTYAEYLLLHFPVLGVLKALVLAELIVRLFPAVTTPGATAPEREPPAPPSRAEQRLFLILIGALGLWATDWLHGVSAGWIALVAGLVCLLPRTGVIDSRTFETTINFSSIFYVAGVLGMAALIDQSRLGDALGRAALSLLPLEPGAGALNFAYVVGANAATSLVTALAGAPAVLTPIAQPIADAAGVSLKAVLMAQVIGFSCMLLPYQSAPLMVGIALARIPFAAASRLSVPLGLLTILVLVPLDFAWWRFLGYW